MTDGKADYKILVTDVGKYLYYYGYTKGRVTKGHTEQGKKEGAEKISKKLSGKTFTPEVIAKRSAKLKGHVVTQETRNKISQKLKGKSYYTIESYKKTLETRKKNNKPYPESAREKIRKHQLTNNSIHNATLIKVCVIKDGKRKCISAKNLEKYLENGYKIYHKGDLKHEQG